MTSNYFNLNELFKPLLGSTTSRGRCWAAIRLSHHPEPSGCAVHEEGDGLDSEGQYSRWFVLLRHTHRRQWSQWRAEVWWCPGRLLDWMSPYQILLLSSGVRGSLLLDIRCLFVTLQYDVIFTFANQHFGDVCWHNMHIQDAGATVGRGSSKTVEGNGNL